MKISSFVDFETALSIVRELNINSVSNWCLENNIKLIRIPYKKKNKIFKILSIELK